MRVKFENLGAVKEATIDLSKKLTVFCGPNNTGKTYVAYAVYGVIRTIYLDIFLLDNKRDFIPKESLEPLRTKGEAVIKLKSVIFDDIDSLIKPLKEFLKDLYGVSANDMKQLFGEFTLSFDTSEKHLKEVITGSEFEKSIKLKKPAVTLRLTKKKNTDTLKITSWDAEGNKAPAPTSTFGASTLIRELLVRYRFHNAYIFPVERNSIYTFSKELSIKRNMLIDEIQKVSDKKMLDPFDWINRRTTRYPQPIRDSLGVAEDLVNYQKTTTEFFDFASEIEEQILEGKISVSKDGEVLFTSNRAKGKKIPIHLSSSLVKTLSSLVFYLKHLAKPRDLIIIDEPELNLHPDNQIRLTRCFAQLIHKGFRLLVSTHSDYILRELNNLIMLSSIKDEGKKQALGYHQEHALRPEEVGAYLFKRKTSNARKVQVTPLAVDFEGFDVDTIDDTITDLNDRSEELYQHIYEQNEQEDGSH